MSAARGPVPFDLAPPGAADWFGRYGPGLVAVLPAQRPGPGSGGRSGPPHGGAWLHVGEDGAVRAFTGKVEVGQGTRTALSLLVAEELGIAPAAVDLTMGDTDVCPWDMGTFGSRSMPDAGEHLRATAAAARRVLRELAAARLGVAPEAIDLRDGRASVRGESAANSVAVGDLVGGLRRVETALPTERPVPPTAWSRAGRAAATLGGESVVTGARQYTSDLSLPGMLHGKLLSPPIPDARLLSVDVSVAQAMPGVTVVREGDLVGVAAPDLLSARTAVRSIRAEWEVPARPGEKEVVEYLRSHPAEGEDFWDRIRVETGDPTGALAEAPVTLRATYTTAYIAHVPMETHAVLAAWDEGRLTVWMGTQTPFRAREAVSDAFGLRPADVRIVVPPTGSGFGGKHASELAAAAARLARAAGRPVRIAFTREEEFTRAYLRPMAVIDVRSATDRDGNLVAWEFHDLNAGAAAARTPYRVPNQQVDNQPAESPLPQGSYRALAATANNFARESQIDELAAKVGADPVEYRARHLSDERLVDVLRAVAGRSRWVSRASARQSRSRDGRGQGIAVGLEKGGRVATFAEVEVRPDRRLEVVRLVTGFECGAIVHPANLRNQVEGGTIMAMGGALFEGIRFDGGRITNPRLSQYRVPRFRDIPAIEVLLLDRRDLPSQGGGETPLIAVAPAIANAIFDACGRRLRDLPLAPDGTVP